MRYHQRCCPWPTIAGAGEQNPAEWAKAWRSLWNRGLRFFFARKSRRAPLLRKGPFPHRAQGGRPPFSAGPRHRPTLVALGKGQTNSQGSPDLPAPGARRFAVWRAFCPYTAPPWGCSEGALGNEPRFPDLLPRVSHRFPACPSVFALSQPDDLRQRNEGRPPCCASAASGRRCW